MIQQASHNGCVIRYSASSSAPAKQQLVVFPHAGGSASFYQPWRQRLPEECDLFVVQYPGRETQGTERPWPSAEKAITVCANALHSLLGIAPITFFGHSMGALLALHVASSLRNTRFTIRQLVLSAQKVPEELVELNKAKTRKALVESILAHSEQSGVMELDDLTRTSVADFILQDLELLAQLALLPINDLPLRIFGSENDPLLGVSQLERWRETVTNSQVTTWPGGHFYFKQDIDEFLRQLLQ
ncbi:alpha/beta fold hydrolase [Prodigiosinella aquatilis]|nr:alpha/beta fold hydrolase [Prodigiosinella sp. LS101]WJV54749.1 alpha/beta fold hydrolase [Prodigiosinella sp. LS101]WJV59113.1 alpha/beta fold hydrolase [Pectobacteriaceae bacterium C111]